MNNTAIGIRAYLILLAKVGIAAIFDAHNICNFCLEFCKISKAKIY